MYKRLNVSTNDARLSSDLPPADIYPPADYISASRAFFWTKNGEFRCQTLARPRA